MGNFGQWVLSAKFWWHCFAGVLQPTDRLAEQCRSRPQFFHFGRVGSVAVCIAAVDTGDVIAAVGIAATNFRVGKIRSGNVELAEVDTANAVVGCVRSGREASCQVRS